MTNNYRITFGSNVNCNYWNKPNQNGVCFKDLPDVFYPTIDKIYKLAEENNIKYIWHFYEPFVEITWISENDVFLNNIIELLNKNNIKIESIKTPKDGYFIDWFCCNDLEKEFGGKRYSLCADFVKIYNEYKNSVDAGKGLKEQIKRTIHGICNPLGLNYIDECKICFSRGLICLLFSFFSFNRAIWIYTKIFRQKY